MKNNQDKFCEKEKDLLRKKSERREYNNDSKMKSPHLNLDPMCLFPNSISENFINLENRLNNIYTKTIFHQDDLNKSQNLQVQSNFIMTKAQSSVFKDLNFNLISIILEYCRHEEIKNLVSLGNKKISKLAMKWTPKISKLTIQNFPLIKIRSPRYETNYEDVEGYIILISKIKIGPLPYLDEFELKLIQSQIQIYNKFSLRNPLNVSSLVILKSFKKILNITEKIKLGIGANLLLIFFEDDEDFTQIHKDLINRQLGYVRQYDNFKELLFFQSEKELIIYKLNLENISQSHTLQIYSFEYGIKEMIIYNNLRRIILTEYCKDIYTFRFDENSNREIKINKPYDNIKNKIGCGDYLVDLQKFKENLIVSYFYKVDIEEEEYKTHHLEICLRNLCDSNALDAVDILKVRKLKCDKPILNVFYSPYYSKDRDVLISFHVFSEIKVWKMNTLECIKTIKSEFYFSNQIGTKKISSLFQLKNDAFLLQYENMISIIYVKKIPSVAVNYKNLSNKNNLNEPNSLSPKYKEICEVLGEMKEGEWYNPTDYVLYSGVNYKCLYVPINCKDSKFVKLYQIDYDKGILIERGFEK